MKRNIFLILLILGITVMASAHRQGRRPDESRQEQRIVETLTVSGGLTVVHGSPALRSGETAYIIHGIHRLVGFIDGLKEGAQVTIEGRALTSRQDSNVKFLRPSTLTLDGRTYDMTLPAGSLGPRGRQTLRTPGGDTQRQSVPRDQRRRSRPNIVL